MSIKTNSLIIFLFELHFLLYKEGVSSLYHTPEFDFKLFFSLLIPLSLIIYVNKHCLSSFVGGILL